MPLTVGSRLAHYDVTALIGEGGMGQVYQATDTKLNRQVALKILPEAFAADPDRLARFQREAQVLASLNHPNIAQIHGIEESEDTRALVLELVEGPTLADRITEGPIPVDEALPIAKQIAEALEAAHEAGVIHRDLKPANIKVRDDGTVKVLDFGLAKALDPNPTGDPSQSPTLTAAATQMGVIMGTAAYMSPEQARGKPVDKRADIWSFGVVLYEMLTGHRAFQGEDVSLTLASVMKSDVNVATLPADLPANVRTVLRRCLEKDPTQRVRDIGDVRLAMEGAFETTVSGPVEPTSAAQLQVWQRPIPALVAALLVAVVSVLAVWSYRVPGPQPAVRSTLVDPGSGPIGNPFDAGVALSPDGRRIVYLTAAGGATGLGALYVRELDQLEPRLLAESGRVPFFSPDGQWVGFKGNGAAPWMRVAVTGGPALPIGGAETGAARGASRGSNDTIVFATSDASTGLSRVPVGGGEVEVLTTPDSENEEVDHLFPEFLPGGNAVLFTITNSQGVDNAQIALFDMETGGHRILIPGGSDARYVASGHIVYGVAGTLRAVPFDLDALEVRGTPVPVVDGVVTRVTGAASFSVSPDGTLVYVVGGADSAVRRFVWVDRDGRSDPIPTIPPGNYGNPRLSPDGGRLLTAADGDLWIYDLSSGRRSDITTDELTAAAYSAWSPDGSQVAYSSTRSGTSEVWLQAADASGEPQQLTQFGGGSTDVESWSPNGDVLAFHHHGPSGATDLFMIPLGADNPTPQPFLATEFAENMTQFSPDGRFVAYLSDRTGERQIYIRPYPGPGAAVTVSIDGGVEPIWGRNGELFYRHPLSNAMMGVVVSTDPTLTVGVPERLFDGQEYVAYAGGGPSAIYDVTEDGQRFLMEQDADREGSGAVPSQIIMVQNWLEELKQLVPVR